MKLLQRSSFMLLLPLSVSASPLVGQGETRRAGAGAGNYLGLGVERPMRRVESKNPCGKSRCQCMNKLLLVVGPRHNVVGSVEEKNGESGQAVKVSPTR
jgi:hypothetical protein